MSHAGIGAGAPLALLLDSHLLVILSGDSRCTAVRLVHKEEVYRTGGWMTVKTEVVGGWKDKRATAF